MLLFRTLCFVKHSNLSMIFLMFKHYIFLFLKDFDIVGSHDLMLPDVECIKVLVDILKSIDVGEFVIKLNHRQLLNGIFETCGVPEEKFKSICSAIDKLDKVKFGEIHCKMIN